MKELINTSKSIHSHSYGKVLKQLIIQLQKQDFSGLPGNRRLKVNRQQRQLCRDGRTYFPELILRGNWLEEAGFKKIEVSVVAREEQPPHFETVLASGQK